jgi:Large ribosomal RNA subunit accumulation protein YceD
MTSELYRPVALSKIGPRGLTIAVRATPEECAAVAARMDLPAIHSLDCRFTLAVETGGVSVSATGRLRAQVTRVCVTSAEDFETTVEDEFTVRFVPTGTEREDPDPDLPDEIPYEADTIDLGEAAAEQLGLALDPYPRMPGATVPDIGDNDDTSPFAILARRGGSDDGGH